jgi:hypothetical protein
MTALRTSVELTALPSPSCTMLMQSAYSARAPCARRGGVAPKHLPATSDAALAK